MYNIPFIIP
ncbi:hypothetical protein MTR67_048765 [Solanum verrucosum]|uniref:Uncharacterized protein n=1 Tax=Solanum verrucosum TaxID=315347 RepID=A0AAF0V072_SOLVR|nr:hypothetical protein MTR67_048765 [Solanum verrucosum]